MAFASRIECFVEVKCADLDVCPFGLKSTEFSETPSPDSDSVNSLEGHSEPSWFKDIKFDDSDTEQLADETDDTVPSLYHMSYSSRNVVFLHLQPLLLFEKTHCSS